MADTATNEPLDLVAGDRWQWRREDLAPDYPASSWTLHYYFKNAAEEFDFVAVADGDNFSIDQTPTDTDSFVAGTYKWAAYVSKTGDRKQIDEGTLVVKPDLTASGTSDQRTHAEKVLDAIEAVIENRASQDQSSYSIGGRSLSRTPLKELQDLRRQYRSEVIRQRRAEVRKQRKPDGTRRVARFE